MHAHTKGRRKRAPASLTSRRLGLCVTSPVHPQPSLLPTAAELKVSVALGQETLSEGAALGRDGPAHRHPASDSPQPRTLPVTSRCQTNREALGQIHSSFWLKVLFYGQKAPKRPHCSHHSLSDACVLTLKPKFFCFFLGEATLG